MSPVPYVAEMESGIWHGYHYTKGIPYPEHYRFALLTVLAAGAAGWNWYMLHDRDNWYMSVLNDKGRKRLEVWSVFSRFVELERQLEPFAWSPCAETGITHDRPHLGRGVRAAEYEDRGDVWRGLYEAGIDYRVWHLGARSAPPKVLLRITPGVDAHTHEYLATGAVDSKFGLPLLDDLAFHAVRRYPPGSAIGLRTSPSLDIRTGPGLS